MLLFPPGGLRTRKHFRSANSISFKQTLRFSPGGVITGEVDRSVKSFSAKQMLLLPPGGLITREDGRSVKTFPEFMLLPFAKVLLEHLLPSSSILVFKYVWGRRTSLKEVRDEYLVPKETKDSWTGQQLEWDYCIKGWLLISSHLPVHPIQDWLSSFLQVLAILEKKFSLRSQNSSDWWESFAKI
jgi:hypothetical protein